MYLNKNVVFKSKSKYIFVLLVLYSQLYRSSSFNSSGRSSNCDNSESDMYPDMEDVQNINYKVS